MFEHVFTLLQGWQQHCTLPPDTPVYTCYT